MNYAACNRFVKKQDILIFRQQIPVEMAGKQPMDMITYYRLFGMTRMPRDTTDVQTFHPDSKHIIVAHNQNVSPR